MARLMKYAGIASVALMAGVIPSACSSSTRAAEEAGPAQRDTANRSDTVAIRRDPVEPRSDTAGLRADTSAPRRDTVRARRETTDTPPGADQGSAQLSKVEYEGWRQYSVNCARCHGQDVLPNPVAANLLISLAPGGPIDTEAKYTQVVSEGRPARGMPAFKTLLTPDQIKASYAYVKGRAEKRIPPGRPEPPA